jgi:hypothetical protein
MPFFVSSSKIFVFVGIRKLIYDFYTTFFWLLPTLKNELWQIKYVNSQLKKYIFTIEVLGDKDG